MLMLCTGREWAHRHIKDPSRRKAGALLPAGEVGEASAWSDLRLSG